MYKITDKSGHNWEEMGEYKRSIQSVWTICIAIKKKNFYL